MHTADFWCSLFISDVSYVFSGNHRKPTAEIWKCADFGVELKTRRSGTLGALRPDKRLVKLSKALGVDVFANADADEGFIAKALLSEPIFKKLRGIDFCPILEFNLCPLRLVARSSLQSANHCAEQAQLFRDVIELVFQDGPPKADQILNGRNGRTDPRPAKCSSKITGALVEYQRRRSGQAALPSGP